MVDGGFPKSVKIYSAAQRHNDQGGVLTLKYASLCADIFGNRTCNNRDRYTR